MSAAPDFWPSALKMLASLALVLGGLLGVLALLRRRVRERAAGSPGGLLRVAAVQPLGVKHRVVLLEAPGCALVVGVSPEQVSLLARIEEPEVLERLRAQPPAAAASFFEHLARVTAGWRGGGGA